MPFITIFIFYPTASQKLYEHIRMTNGSANDRNLTNDSASGCFIYKLHLLHTV